MSRETIQEAQEFLTMISEDRVRRIVDIEPLLARHPKESVLSMLESLYSEKKDVLAKLIQEDKTSSRINELIVTLFRIHMAMKIIEGDGKEVKAA
jgi:hypothetical protein